MSAAHWQALPQDEQAYVIIHVDTDMVAEGEAFTLRLQASEAGVHLRPTLDVNCHVRIVCLHGTSDNTVAAIGADDEIIRVSTYTLAL